jgi:hypothetical protein
MSFQGAGHLPTASGGVVIRDGLRACPWKRHSLVEKAVDRRATFLDGTNKLRKENSNG